MNQRLTATGESLYFLPNILFYPPVYPFFELNRAKFQTIPTTESPKVTPLLEYGGAAENAHEVTTGDIRATRSVQQEFD